jgi:hypothetical protein
LTIRRSFMVSEMLRTSSILSRPWSKVVPSTGT